MPEKFEVTIKESLVGGYRYTTIVVEAKTVKEAVDLVRDYDIDDCNWQLFPEDLAEVTHTDKDPEFSAKRIQPDNLIPPQLGE